LPADRIAGRKEGATSNVVYASPDGMLRGLSARSGAARAIGHAGESARRRGAYRTV
jgi:hypothetical protein